MLLTPALFVLIFGGNAVAYLGSAAGKTGGFRVMYLVMGMLYIPMTAGAVLISVGAWLRLRELRRTERLS